MNASRVLHKPSRTAKVREKDESESRELFAESRLFVECIRGGCELTDRNKNAE